MNTTELRKGTRVKVVKGLWKGYAGVVEEIHDKSSVIRLTNGAGETAYAFKEDVTPV